MTGETIAPSHPGEHLREFLEEFGIDAQRLAHDIHVPPQRIDDLIESRNAITADTALRLARYFGTTAQFWMSLQAGYDLALARQAVDIEAIHPLAA